MSADASVPSARRIQRRLRIRHLELLLALKEARSLHKAATHLNLSQPAASKLLREIEEMFGLPLFVRSRRGIAANRFGVALIGKAALLLADLAAARDEIASLAQGAAGHLRVGVQQVVLPVLLPAAFGRLRAAFPRVGLQLHEGASEFLLNALAGGELDCVVGRISSASPGGGLRWERLYAEPVCVVSRVGHPLAGRRQVSAAMLARQEWILPARGAPIRQVIDEYFHARGMNDPFPAVESVSVLANVALMQETELVAPFPLGVARHYAQAGLLALLRFRPDWLLPDVGIAVRESVADTPALAAFRAILVEAASEVAGAR